MSVKKQYKSDAFESIHELMSALHKINAIDDARMQEYDEACLASDQEPLTQTAGEQHHAHKTHRVSSTSRHQHVHQARVGVPVMQ